MKFIVALNVMWLSSAVLAVGESHTSPQGDHSNHQPATASAKFMTKMAHHSHGHHAHSPHHRTTVRDAEAREIQTEVEDMVGRVHKLNDPGTTAEFAKELGNVEASLTNNDKQDTKLVTEISEVRAELCVEAGFERTEYDDCEDFMNSQCSHTAQNQAVVPAAFCTSFFAEEAAKQHGASAPAPGSMSSPGPAPGPGPAITPMVYDKKIQPLHEQGFKGDFVMHKDMDTHTSDWREEFGPKSGQRTYREICADNPGNEWCRLHGFFDEETNEKSGVPSLQGCGLASAAVLLAFVVCY